MLYGDKSSEPVRIEDVPTELQRQFCLSSEQVEELARQALAIERHYGVPMDIEWALDGEDGGIHILQARPETVQSHRNRQPQLERFRLLDSGERDLLATGRSIGQRITSGRVRVIDSIEQMHQLQPGEILVTDMTDPNWEPVMSSAGAIVTNRGGRTCHAAIVARELGVPALVGCGNATTSISTDELVTVSCAEGDEGYVYRGELEYEMQSLDMSNLPSPPCSIMMNIGNPDRVFSFQMLPNHGIGLARLEFIINRMIGIHPGVIFAPERLNFSETRQLQQRIYGYEGPREFYLGKLTEGIATLAAGVDAKPVIIRLSDFKSNEYARLLGGQYFEPQEENPMLGFRGASRYVSDSFRACFELECEALRAVRNSMGFTNIEVMVPFVRTPQEAEQVVGLLAENGLVRGENGLRLIMMCEIPSNALLAEQFLQYFDGFSIGSNDLTQLTLGLDRDSGLVAQLFDERNEAVLALLERAIRACQDAGKYVGICGQGPSDYPDLAKWLVERGISSISLNPDAVIETWMQLTGQGDDWRHG